MSEKLFFNVNSSETMAYTDFTFCILILHIHPEGTVSQIFYLGLGFYYKICKHHF